MKRLTFLLVGLFLSLGGIQAQGLMGTEVGYTAPDIVLNNPQGEPISLYSLRGQVVLIDFWASWCGPCRRENPNLVEAYGRYNNADFKNAKSFAIYSISLDKKSPAWLKAIQNDNLYWNTHVLDVGGTASRQYGVSSIPTSFLVDANGVILAKNLRGNRLDQALKQLAANP